MSDYLSTTEHSRAGVAPQYLMLAEGVEELQRFGDVSDLGIIATHGITFDFAMMSRPVSGYPLWQWPEAPQLAPDAPMPAGVDIALLGRFSSNNETVIERLREKMADDFRLCRETRYWSIFVRNELAERWC